MFAEIVPAIGSIDRHSKRSRSRSRSRSRTRTRTRKH